MKHSALLLVVCSIFLLIPSAVHAQDLARFAGEWELLPASSSDIDHFRILSLTIRTDGKAITVVQRWRARLTVTDSVTLVPGAKPIEAPVEGWVNPLNVYMGMRRPEGSKRTLSAKYDPSTSTVTVLEKLTHRGSQGPKPVTVEHHYTVTKDPGILTYIMKRSTRKPEPEVKYNFKLKGTRHGYVIRLNDDFTIPGGLPANATMISLQGLANKTGPVVYLLYPADWPFTYVNSVYDFYRTKRHWTFTELKTPADAIKSLSRFAKGYVVWDTSVRTSLIVAFTVAGLEDAVVVSEAEIPLVQQAGLKPVEDFRGKFTGMNDFQIYSWARDRYWSRCSREYLIWLGGEHGTMMKPAVADWGIVQKVFFNDLSTRVTDKEEYGLADQLLSEMKPMSMVMGWHSYKKDLEEEHLTLTSKYGHRVEGLNSLPNLSFSAQIPVSPGFVFKNNHHVKPGEKIQPKEKVYVTCIQTDGMGLGAWLKPGRGEIPYAWECLMNYTWMAPGMAEYFYSTATPNDYLIGCLSGPGYLYPKAVPPKYLKQLIAMAREQMKTLDLRVFETMDWSEGSEVEGNTDLPQSVIDMYYDGMPEAIGFVNGYGAGYTFTVRDGRPFVSYDYYISPHRPEADAVTDLQELATLNTKRPYFLLVHVREYSDVKRVRGILDKLGSEFEVVPLDVFLTMAGSQPTFENYVLPEKR
ncbi:MAG: hypothetical protein IT282_13955 [Bacteroidetes bacterium]|nr:hypothetical protein [Bacteroidota bacterium]